MLQACAVRATLDGLEMLFDSPADLTLERHVHGDLTLIISSMPNDSTAYRIALPSKRQISLSIDKLSQQRKVHVRTDSGCVVITVPTSEELAIWLTKLQPDESMTKAPSFPPTHNRQ